LKKGIDTFIDSSVSLNGAVKIGDRCSIGAHVIIGQPSIEEVENARERHSGKLKQLYPKTAIGDDVIVQPNVLISSNVVIGKRVKIGPFVTIGTNTSIGERTQVMYNSQIHENVRIGRDCIIGGFLCDFSDVGNCVIIMGSLLHAFRDGWDEEQNLKNQSPIIEDNVIVCYGSMVIGNVRIKSGTYVAAGAIVTKNTPGNCVVKSVNECTEIEAYRGRLKDGRFFRGAVI